MSVKTPQKADERRKARMDRIDAMPPEMRALVYKYGSHIVNSFVSHGVKKPASIRHLVEVVLDEFSPTRGSFSSQGIRTPHIDAFLKGDASE